MKQNKKEKKGLLGQQQEMEAMEGVEATPMVTEENMKLMQQLELERIQSQEMQQRLQNELTAQRNATREVEIRMEAKMRAIIQEYEEKNAQRRQQQAAPPTSSQGAVVLCECRQPAERLIVKKDGARKGRAFFKCMQRECQFFLWEKREDGSNVDSWSVVSSEEAYSRRSFLPTQPKASPPLNSIKSPRQAEAAPARRRSKSPRRPMDQTAGQEAVEVSD